MKSNIFSLSLVLNSQQVMPFKFLCIFKDGELPQGAEGGKVDPRTLRKRSSSRKSFRLDYRLEVITFLLLCAPISRCVPSEWK